MPVQVVSWQFTDGKPGHENQSRGLIHGLATRTSVENHTVEIPTNTLHFLYTLLNGRLYRKLARLPKPNYLIAAGRRTQLPMLLAHLWFGGKRIILMRPYWPTSWFDLMIIPQHDSPHTSPKNLITQGVINTVIPSSNHDENKGMILIGGPSKHYAWDTASIVQQITALLNGMPDISWSIANSRRTPEDFSAQINEIPAPFDFIDYRQTSKDWLSEQLATTGQIWVTPDSVSMLYEAVTSGAAVGCLQLQTTNTNNRIVSGINELINKGMITPFSQWQKTRHLSLSSQQLNEAQRAADWILKQ
jgi:mitochondrial fission protein ELM1